MPVEKDQIYDRGYHAERHGRLIGDEKYFWTRSKASARIYFTPEERQKRIFEYGCGIGQGIASLPNAAGWDVSSEALELCRHRNIRVYDHLPDVPRRAWDIVLCRHVLEHLENPLEHLKQMRELIADGGELYLILPYEYHYTAPLEPDLDQHLFCWNFRTANNLVLRAGLKPHRNNYVYVLGYRAFMPVRKLLGETAYHYALLAGGRLKHNAELVIRARRA
jgi:SAM-dependent methyltransferase